MQKEKIKALQKYLKSVGKFARQEDTLSQLSSIPILGPGLEQPPIVSDPCGEEQIAETEALVNIDRLIAALDAALLTAVERSDILAACRLRNQA